MALQGKLDEEVRALKERIRELQGQLAERTDSERHMALLNALMDSIPDNIYFKDVDSRFTLVNRSQARHLKLSHPSEAIGKTDFDFFTADHAAKAFEDEQKVVRTGEPVKGKEEMETWSGGKETWVSTTKMPLRDEKGRIVGTFGISRDISLRKQVEKQLEESEARFRAVIQLAPDIIYRVDAMGRIVFISQAVEMLGYEPESLLGQPFEDIVWPEDVPKMRRQLVEHRVGARATRDLEIRLLRKPAKKRGKKRNWMDASISARGLWDVQDDQIGQSRKVFLGTEGIIRDVTERKRVEEELRSYRDHLEELVAERTAELSAANQELTKQIADRQRAEAELRRERDRARMYFDIAGTMMLVLDAEGRVTLINRRGCDILGFHERDLLGRNWFESFIPAEVRKAVAAGFRKLMNGTVQGIEYYENEVLGRGGQRRLIAWHNSILRDESGRTVGTLSSGEDITERRSTEEAVLQGERLEAIGTMAGGVALRFNDMINAISGSASSVAANSSAHSRLHDEALKILDATHQAGDLTRRLMMVAHASRVTGEERPEPVPLGEVLKNAMEFVEQSFAAKGIQMQVKGVDEMPFVRGSAGPLLDSLMAILVNAAEAMPDGGTITIDAVEKRVSRPNPRLNPLAAPGRYVALRVKDTGAGISAEVLNKIFKPFFTTKKTGTSFGLGLPFSLSVVRRMGGWLAIRSKVGQGTTVQIVLPKADRVPTSMADRRSVNGRHAVLLVDDREGDLASMVKTLDQAGFKSFHASSAEDAVAIYEKKHKEIAVAVVDATVAGGGGNLLLRELPRLDPQLSFVLTSGFSRDFIRSRVTAGAWNFLQKPFEGAQLVETVNDAVRQVVERAEAAQRA